jgi:hypothetical protein
LQRTSDEVAAAKEGERRVLAQLEEQIALNKSAPVSSEATPTPFTVPSTHTGGEDSDALKVELEKTQEELKTLQIKYNCLETEQEELLILLARLEIENNNLRERSNLLGTAAPSS